MSQITPSMNAILSLATLQSKLLKRVDLQMSVHGISFTEYLVMYHLNNAPKKTLRRIELAESIGLSASGVTRVLAPMEKIKLVQKEANPRDARVSMVKLSNTGKTIFKDSTLSFKHIADQALQSLSSKDVNCLLSLTEKLS